MSDHSVGILIIGSLLWDSKPHRVRWRNGHLNVCSKIPVQVPIRYGRESKDRDYTYTMVFSNELNGLPDRMGWGFAIPCRSAVKTIDALVSEAKALWEAEQTSNKKPEHLLSANWGAVALLANPDNDNLDTLKSNWAKLIEAERKGFYNTSQNSKNEQQLNAKNEHSAINPDGSLAIEWPKDEHGEPLNMDLLLATATVPTLIDKLAYALPKDIAKKWSQYPSRLRYFDENRRAGITTADDYEIIQHLGRST